MGINLARKVILSIGAFGLVLCLSGASFGYSVLTHQAIIDSTWVGQIKPILLKRCSYCGSRMVGDDWGRNSLHGAIRGSGNDQKDLIKSARWLADRCQSGCRFQ